MRKRRHWIGEDDYKHDRNFAVGGTVFATTTVLDFGRAFARPAAADSMTSSLLDDCQVSWESGLLLPEEQLRSFARADALRLVRKRK